MKRIFGLSLFIFCILSFFCPFIFAGDPPVSLKGQFSTKMIPKWNLQVPYSSATNVGGIDGLIETGNQNILVNPSFENFTYSTGWTIPTGVVQTGTALVLDGKQAMNGLPSLGVLAEQSLNVVHTTSVNYEYSISMTTNATYTPQPTMKVCALAAGVEVYCSGDYILARDVWQKMILNYPSPTSGTVGIRVKCTANCPVSGGIVLDNAYVGIARNLFNVSQAYRYGSASWAPITNCVWGGPSTSYANFTADTDCNTPTVTENAAAPGTKIPGLVFATMPAGVYSFRAVGTFLSPAVQNACFRISDGTNTTRGSCIYVGSVGSTNAVATTIEGSWTLTAPLTNVTIQLQGLSSSSNPSIDGRPTALSDGLFIDVFYFPFQNQQGVAPDQADYDPVAYTPSIGGVGTATNISFTQYKRGKILIVDGMYTAGNPATAPALQTYSLPNGLLLDSAVLPSNTTVAAGPIKGWSAAQGGASQAFYVVTAAGTSTSLVYGAAGLYSANALLPSNGTTVIGNGQTVAVHFEVPIAGWRSSAGAPALIGSISTGGLGLYRQESFQSTGTAGSCVIGSQTSSGFYSLSSGTTFNPSCTFGYSFLSTPFCQISSTGQASGQACRFGSSPPTATSMVIDCPSTTNLNVTVTCWGVR